MKITKERLSQLVENKLAKGGKNKKTMFLTKGEMVERLNQGEIAVLLIKEREELEKEVNPKGYTLCDYTFLSEEGALMGAKYDGNFIDGIRIGKVTILKTESESTYIIIKVKPEDFIKGVVKNVQTFHGQVTTFI